MAEKIPRREDSAANTQPKCTTTDRHAESGGCNGVRDSRFQKFQSKRYQHYVGSFTTSSERCVVLFVCSYQSSLCLCEAQNRWQNNDNKRKNVGCVFDTTNDPKALFSSSKVAARHGTSRDGCDGCAGIMRCPRRYVCILLPYWPLYVVCIRWLLHTYALRTN